MLLQNSLPSKPATLFSSSISRRLSSRSIDHAHPPDRLSSLALPLHTSIFFISKIGDFNLLRLISSSIIRIVDCKQHKINLLRLISSSIGLKEIEQKTLSRWRKR
ncbi:hypothetical protein L6452_03097 [Arctium lappa]|uniref:Uncharacterized protein n=1 Tax=Arctium lappa TaxID=4217 RepID=A0ACB9FM98_ARCLA|nr:hypothetical protein L6452_03097 [Arctium lappa]